MNDPLSKQLTTAMDALFRFPTREVKDALTRTHLKRSERLSEIDYSPLITFMV
jgi:hypothetical protein